jgi:hypothetical protein
MPFSFREKTHLKEKKNTKLLNFRYKMESDVTLTNTWVYRRFFLSNIRSAPRLFCCNTSDGFTFGQINFDVSYRLQLFFLELLLYQASKIHQNFDKPRELIQVNH